jgi:AAA+ superfamily predicted ATPase
MSDDFFDYVQQLPDPRFEAITRGLVGFQTRYTTIAASLRLILEREDVEKWSQRVHGLVIPACRALADRHPLVLFEGDVGTGKTANAESIADRLCRDLKREGCILKLSTRVRGQGFHGEMSRLLQEGFQRLIVEAGKRRLAFLLIDEADALATRRATEQMHQEEKAGVNTLIQKLDEIRAVQGRAVVFLTTNRPDVLDPAVVRRASVRCVFARPTDEERRGLLRQELKGTAVTSAEIDELVRLTGHRAQTSPGFTFSDLRHRLLPEAIAVAYPDQPITYAVLADIASRLVPSPVVADR